MSRIGGRTHLLAIALPLMLVLGCWQVGSGLWIYAKARLAQYLLQRAWSRTLTGEANVKPWPWADTWPIARLIVPSQHIDLIVLEGAYGRTLAFGPGRLESNASHRETGPTILTGHRDTHFAFLQHLRVGDHLVLQSSHGEYISYRIRETRIVDAGTGFIPTQNEGLRLILATCYPFNSPIPGGPLRYVVTADAERMEKNRNDSEQVSLKISGGSSSWSSTATAARD